MTFLSKQIPFISSFKKRLLVGFILGFLLAFIIIFLQPFDTNTYKSNHKTFILSGFGILFFCVYLIQSSAETIIYRGFNTSWTVSFEIISALTFFTISGTVIYLYNHGFINRNNYTLTSYLRYFKNIVLVFIPIFLPIYIYLRNKFGELIIPEQKNTFTITGENKNETLKFKKKDVIYIKAIENYIDIIYIESDQNIASKTFRQTLSKANQQLPFLEKCHRSYLFNFDNLKEIKGNSQNAKLHFNNTEQSIPLSKTYYPKIKNKISVS